jgi:hypothetical protein
MAWVGRIQCECLCLRARQTCTRLAEVVFAGYGLESQSGTPTRWNGDG